MSKKFYVPIEMTRKYVRENEIYEKIDGQLVRITPQMISEIVREGRLVEVHFVEVDNEEVYREYMKQIWREGKAYERRNRCMVPNGKGKLIQCDGKCSCCEHKGENIPLSIDAFNETYCSTSEAKGSCKKIDIHLTTESPEKEVMEAEVKKLLWERIEKLCADDQTIIKMLGDGVPESKIATAIGVTQPAVNYRKKKILAELKKYFENLL